MSPTSERPAESQAQAERFDPRELLRIASVYRWLIATVAALVVVVVAVFTFTATPIHRAKARLLIEKSGNNAVSFQEIYQLGAGTEDYYLTQHKILESRAIAAAALELLPPADRAWFQAAGPADPVLALQQMIAIQPVLKSRLVDVVADHPDPAVAVRMADAVVAAYVKNGLDRQSNASTQALDKLKKDAEELQTRLVTAEKAVQQFKQQNEIVAMNDRQSLAAARLEKLNDELADIERTRSEASSRLAAADAVAVAGTEVAVDGDLPEALQSPAVADCKRALLTSKAEASLLAQSYKQKHPRMLAAQGKVEAMEAELRREIAAVREGLKSQVERAVHREADVRRRLDEQKRSLLELEGKAIQYQILRDEAESTRRLHETVIARFKEVQLIHGAETTNVHRIGPAEVSARPVRPNKPFNLAMALLGGLLLAFGCAFTLEVCDRTLKGSDDASRCLDLPLLGLVPRFKHGAGDAPGFDGGTLDERSTAAEAFRTIRTALAFTAAGRDMRSLLVTSTAPSEGKSTVSTNLAVAFARAGKRVLLVDADLRRPRLHKAFGVDGAEGLSSLLIGNCELDAVVRRTAVPNLSLLPCGVIPPNPVELLGSPAMQSAYAAMLAAFDLVLFDSPPVGVVSDAAVLATMTGRVAFVVRSLRTNRGHARHALDRLHAVGARPCGVIVNHSDTRASRYGGYESDYSYHASDATSKASAKAAPAPAPQEDLAEVP